jgi:hypothetical protein
VDGHGQAPRRWEANGRLTAFATTEGYDYAEAEAAPAYAGRLSRFRRHVVHARPGIFVMFDELQAPEPARFQWLLHAYRRMEVGESNRVVRVENDPAAMDVHLLLPDRVEFSQTDKYVPEPEPIARQWENTWHLSAGTPEPARTAQFLAVMFVHRKGQAGALPSVELVRGKGAVGARLRSADGAEGIVAFRTDPEVPSVSCGGIDSAARAFAQQSDRDGQVRRRFSHTGP